MNSDTEMRKILLLERSIRRWMAAEDRQPWVTEKSKGSAWKSAEGWIHHQFIINSSKSVHGLKANGKV